MTAQGFAATLADYHAADRHDRAAADQLPLSGWSESRRDLLSPQTVAMNWRANVADTAHDLRESLTAAENGGTAGDPANVRAAAVALLRALGEDIETGPHRWAVVNIPVTAVLGTFATEAEAQAFNEGDPGAFVYLLSPTEAANLAAARADADGGQTFATVHADRQPDGSYVMEVYAHDSEGVTVRETSEDANPDLRAAVEAFQIATTRAANLSADAEDADDMLNAEGIHEDACRTFAPLAARFLAERLGVRW